MLYSNAASIYSGTTPPRRKVEWGTALAASVASGAFAGLSQPHGINRHLAEVVAPAHAGAIQGTATTLELSLLAGAVSFARVPPALVYIPPPYLPKLYHVSRLACDVHETTWRRIKGLAALARASAGPSLPAKVALGACIDVGAVALGLSPLTGLTALSMRDGVVTSEEWPCAGEVGAYTRVEYPALTGLDDVSHPHPRSAASREAFLRMAGRLAAAAGRTVYDLQASKRSKELYSGQFYPYGSKDRSEQYADPLPARPLFIEVDCAYYWDGCYGTDSGYAAVLGTGTPMASYALSPRCIPCETDERTVTFAGPDSLDVVDMVKGNGSTSTYRHQVWSLDTDQVATTAFGTVTISAVTVHPGDERDPHKTYVLTPKRHFPVGRGVPVPTLAPFRPTWYRNVWALRETRKVLGGAGDGYQEVVRAGIAGCPTSYITNPTGWAALLTRTATLRDNDKADGRTIAGSAAMLYSEAADLAIELDPSEPLINRCKVAGKLTNQVRAVTCEILNNLLGGRAGDLGRTYLPHVADADVRFKPSMAEATSIIPQPLLPHVGHPGVSKTSSQVSVITRITEVTSGAPGPKDGDVLRASYLRQFISVAGKHDDITDAFRRMRTLVETVQAQSKPTQVAGFMQAAQDAFHLSVDGSFSHTLQAAMKKEAGAYTDPRNVIGPNGAWRAIFSGYCMLAAEIAKRAGWYAFGTSLDELAKRVTEKAAEQEAESDAAQHGPAGPPAGPAQCRYAACVDMSRFDGSVTGFLSNTSFATIRGLISHFAPETNLEPYDRLVRAHFNARATQNGTAFSTGTAVISGSPSTSIGNSVTCNFVGYCANVRAGLSDERAFARSGIFGGDDSLIFVPAEYASAPAAYAAIYEKTARDFGLRAKVLYSDTDCLTLLGRVFVRPAGVRGVPYVHHADVPRCLGKFDLHTKNIPAPAAMLGKAAGLAFSDANTPVLRELVQAVCAHPDVAALQLPRETMRQVASYNVVEELETEYVDAQGAPAATITAAMVLATLDKRHAGYPAAVVASVAASLPVSIAGMCARVQTLAVGQPCAVGTEDPPEVAKMYHTAYGPAAYCKVTSAKLGANVPTTLSLNNNKILATVTAGRVSRTLVAGASSVLDAFGGPGAFAAIASLETTVLSYVLPEAAYQHRQLVAAIGRATYHRAQHTQLRDPQAHAAALAARIPANPKVVAYFDPPWFDDREDGTPADPAGVCAAAFDALPPGATAMFNLSKRHADTMIHHVLSAGAKNKVWVLTHAATSLTEANVIRVGTAPPAASRGRARDAGLVWHYVNKEKLEPLDAHKYYVSEANRGLVGGRGGDDDDS